jgi:hypothetical protein
MQGYIRPGCCSTADVHNRIGEIRTMMEGDSLPAESDRECAAKMLQYFDNIRNPWIMWVLILFGCPSVFIGVIFLGMVIPIIRGPLFGSGLIWQSSDRSECTRHIRQSRRAWHWRKKGWRKSAPQGSLGLSLGSPESQLLSRTSFPRQRQDIKPDALCTNSK